MTASANLALPYLLPNQAQKHVTLNEALRLLDVVVQAGVLSRSLAVPPATPAEGDRYIPAAGATGAWNGHDDELAAFQDGAWAFLMPRQGWVSFVADEGILIVRASDAWLDAIAPALNPADRVGINATADAVNRLAISSPASLFDHEGAGHQLKLNKATVTDTASCLFQTAYSGRAEIGLTGSDNLSLRISADGAAFDTALTLCTDTGYAGFGTDTPASRLHVRQDYDARLTIDTVESGAGGGFDILNSTDGQAWRVTGSPTNFKVRDHTATLDKFLLYPGAAGAGAIVNTPYFGIGTAAPTAQLHVNGPVRIGAFAVTALPDAAATGQGAVILVTDETGGAVPAFSDGTDWRRVTDRAIVS
ncbi:MAG: DUF2793 domain-containing protein [Hyphomonas sp.]